MGEHGSAHPGVRIVRELYEAFGSGDLDRARALVDDEFVWHEPPGHPWSGDHRGFEGLMAINAAAAGASAGTLTVDLHDVVASEDHVVVLQTVTATVEGEPLSLQEVLVAHLRDGRLAEVWVSYFDPSPAERLFSRASAR